MWCPCITFKKLDSWATIDTYSWLSGLKITDRTAVPGVLGSIPTLEACFFVFCCCWWGVTFFGQNRCWFVTNYEIWNYKNSICYILKNTNGGTLKYMLTTHNVGVYFEDLVKVVNVCFSKRFLICYAPRDRQQIKWHWCFRIYFKTHHQYNY